MSAAPPRPGSYLLLLELAQPVTLAAGRLRATPFPAGVYVYTGSAFGPGGLAARLGRHLRAAAAQPCRWHIDYLRRVAPVIDSLWVEAAACECRWAQALHQQGGQVIAPGFGSSDCNAGCPAHLLYFPNEPSARAALLSLLPCPPAVE